MSRGESETMGAIGDEMAVDDLRQLALEAAQRFARGLVLGELAIVVVPPGARVHGLVATGTSKIGDGSVEMIRMLKIARERHRLNRGGDRQANAALHRVVVVRLRWHAPTQAYLARRLGDGKTKPEIMRCLKRYVAREIHGLLCPSGSAVRVLDHGVQAA